MAGKYRNIYYALNRYIFSLLPDTLYHNLLGFIIHRRGGCGYRWMDIRNPRTFSEKLQWLKTHGDIALKTRLADKYDVRQWVADRIGSRYLVDLVPLYTDAAGKPVYTCSDPDKIDFETLPQRFVMKLTKGSGYNLICPDKSALDVESARSRLGGWLAVDNYYLSREPHYRGRNRIMCERMLEYNIRDYKIFCFDGQPRYFKIDADRLGHHHANYYDLDWNLMDLDERTCPRNPSMKAERIPQFEEMLDIARRLSKGFPFVRVDLYLHADKVYFGEMTFIPAGGYAPLMPESYERRLGDMIDLTPRQEQG